MLSKMNYTIEDLPVSVQALTETEAEKIHGGEKVIICSNAGPCGTPVCGVEDSDLQMSYPYPRFLSTLPSSASFF